MIPRLLSRCAAHGAPLLASGIFLGLALPELAALLRPLLTWAVTLILAVTLARIDWGELAAYAGRWRLTLAALAWLLLLSPMLASALLGLLGAPEGVRQAIVLMAGTAPITSVAAFALLIGLDAALAMSVMLTATVAVPFVLPPLALGLLGIELAFGVPAFMLRLALLVGGAFLLALVLRRWLGAAWIRSHGDRLDGVAVILLIVFGIALMDGITALLLSEPAYVLGLTAAAFLANFGLQAAGALAFLRLGAAPALTVGLATGNRNMALLLAVLPPDTPRDIMVYFAVAQFPMYMAPAIQLPLYRRLARLRGATPPPP
ncbi:MAG: hypothetical protein WD270_01475 [Acetobacterales bacterium]